MAIADILTSISKFLRKYGYVFSVFFALTIGIAIGIILKVFEAPPEAAVWLGLPGELFLRALRFCVIPLLCCNLIYASSSLNPKAQGTSALLALIYCLVMNILSSFIGGLVTFGIKPGSYARISGSTSEEDIAQSVQVSDIIADMFRNMIPDNFVNMFLSAVVTTYKDVSSSVNSSETRTQRVLEDSPGVNILGLLVSSVLIGLVSGSLDEEEVSPFIRFFKAAAQVLTRLLQKVMM